MVSPKPLAAKKALGFTMVELAVVIGVLALLAAIFLPIGIDFYISYQFRAESNMLVSLLEQSRSLAMTNNGESYWGLYVDANDFVVFQGLNYASRDQSADKIFARTENIGISGPSELVFANLSGTTTPATFDIVSDEKSATVGVNSQGVISY
ncbi:MAG: hypothetical protein Q8O87_01275 [bacterium]|nr:hypothetical protein [bacterium]